MNTINYNLFLNYIHFKARIDNSFFCPETSYEPNCYILDESLFHPFLDNYTVIGKAKIIIGIVNDAKEAGLIDIYTDIKNEGPLRLLNIVGNYIYSPNKESLLKLCTYAYNIFVDKYIQTIYDKCISPFWHTDILIINKLLELHCNLPKASREYAIFRDYDLIKAINACIITERPIIHNNIAELVSIHNSKLASDDKDYIYKANGVDRWLGYVAYYVSNEKVLKQLIKSTIKSLYDN